MSELYKFPTTFLTEQFVEYVEDKEIQLITTALANNINQRYQGEELVIIGILKGSMIFISDLMKQLKNIKIYIDFVALDSVGRTKESSGTITISKDIKTNILDKNVLIVEEIIDTGRALHFLKERLLQSSPRNIEVLTLFDKPYKRVMPINADYIGKKIEDKFVVGYGLDLEEYGRNIKDLYYLKYPN